MNEKRVLTILFVTLLLDVIGIGILIPVIPALFTNPESASFMLAGYSVGAQYFIAGLMTALFGVMQFLAAPLLGDLSDTYGRKKLLTLGVGVLAVAQLIFAAGIALLSLPLLPQAYGRAGVGVRRRGARPRQIYEGTACDLRVVAGCEARLLFRVRLDAEL